MGSGSRRLAKYGFAASDGEIGAWGLIVERVKLVLVEPFCFGTQTGVVITPCLVGVVSVDARGGENLVPQLVDGGVVVVLREDFSRPLGTRRRNNGPADGVSGDGIT